MNETKFKEIYNESRNGANSMTRHPLVRSFLMSDGVIDLAETGCWWLMDVLATELPAVMISEKETLLSVKVEVHKGKAKITASGYADRVMPWKKANIWTDMPEGTWGFLLAREEGRSVLVLGTEY